MFHTKSVTLSVSAYHKYIAGMHGIDVSDITESTKISNRRGEFS